MRVNEDKEHAEGSSESLADAVVTIDAFSGYLPLSAVRVAPGEYEIKNRRGRTLWCMEGASLADWVAASCNGYETLWQEMNQRATIGEAGTWRRDLIAAGWREESVTAWRDPEDNLWRGPYGAWRELQRRNANASTERETET